jgi:hypothetical protein
VTVVAEHSNDGRWWRRLRAVGVARGSGKDIVASLCDGLMAAAVVRLRFQVVRVELRRQKVLGGAAWWGEGAASTTGNQWGRRGASCRRHTGKRRATARRIRVEDNVTRHVASGYRGHMLSTRPVTA